MLHERPQVGRVATGLGVQEAVLLLEDSMWPQTSGVSAASYH